MKEETIQVTGRVVDKQPDGSYKVRVSSDHIVIALVSGKMRKSLVRIMIGDRVDLELSPHNYNIGRIISHHE